MITEREFEYTPGDHEAEAASNSYLMSLIAIIAGMPIPIINLIATLIFYLGNRKSGPFVRWHCTQALISQLAIFITNSIAFWWSISIFFTDAVITNNYIGYMATILVLNIGEFIATIYTAIHTRKGKHVEWWFYGTLTNVLLTKKL